MEMFPMALTDDDLGIVYNMSFDLAHQEDTTTPYDMEDFSVESNNDTKMPTDEIDNIVAMVSDLQSSGLLKRDVMLGSNLAENEWANLRPPIPDEMANFSAPRTFALESIRTQLTQNEDWENLYLGNTPAQALPTTNNARSLLRSNVNTLQSELSTSSSASNPNWNFKSTSDLNSPPSWNLNRFADTRSPPMSPSWYLNPTGDSNASSRNFNFTGDVGNSLSEPFGLGASGLGLSFGDEDPSRSYPCSDEYDDDDDMSGSETSGDWCDDRTLAANLTPESSDVDTKIKYTTHDHTYSQCPPMSYQQGSRQGMMFGPDVLTPSDTDDSEVDVESLPSEVVSRSLSPPRQQFGVSGQQQTGYRTRIKTMMPVNTKSKASTVAKSCGIKKSQVKKSQASYQASSEKQNNMKMKRKAQRSRRSSVLSNEQSENKRLKHNAAERGRRHSQRELLAIVTQEVAPEYVLPGRVSQRTTMKGASNCIGDYKALHEKTGLDYAVTTAYEELAKLRQVANYLERVVGH